MSSRITYKFMADAEWDNVHFEGHELNLHEFKRRVLIKRDMTDFATDYELFVTDQDKNYTFSSHKESIKAGSRVTIVRRPATKESLLVRILNRKKKQVHDQLIRKPYDMNNTEMSESYKKFLENQAGNEFWAKALDTLSLGDRVVCENRYKKEKTPPLNPNSIRAQPGNQDILDATANFRFRLQQQSLKTGSAVPTGSYVCHRCNRPGHFKHFCPMILESSIDPDSLPSTVPPISEIKRATGIPRSELIELNNYVPGCYITSYGAFAIPRREAENIFHPTKRKQDREPDREDEKPDDLDVIECRICRKVMDEATAMNCCGESYCLICIRSYVLENAKCPNCKEKGKDIEDIIPNHAAREVIEDYYRREQEWIDETWAKPKPPSESTDLAPLTAQIEQMAQVMRTFLSETNGKPEEAYKKVLEAFNGPKKLTKPRFRSIRSLLKALRDFSGGNESNGCTGTIVKLLEYNCPESAIKWYRLQEEKRLRRGNGERRSRRDSRDRRRNRGRSRDVNKSSRDRKRVEMDERSESRYSKHERERERRRRESSHRRREKSSDMERDRRRSDKGRKERGSRCGSRDSRQKGRLVIRDENKVSKTSRDVGKREDEKKYRKEEVRRGESKRTSVREKESLTKQKKEEGKKKRDVAEKTKDKVRDEPRRHVVKDERKKDDRKSRNESIREKDTSKSRDERKRGKDKNDTNTVLEKREEHLRRSSLERRRRSHQRRDDDAKKDRSKCQTTDLQNKASRHDRFSNNEQIDKGSRRDSSSKKVSPSFSSKRVMISPIRAPEPMKRRSSKNRVESKSRKIKLR